MTQGRRIVRMSLRMMAVLSLAIVCGAAVRALRDGVAPVPHAVAAVTLAAAFAAALARSTRGTWVSGLSASVALLAGVVGTAETAGGAAFGSLHGLISRLAGLPDGIALVQAAGAVILLAKSWFESTRRSLGLPRWAGLAAAILCLAPSISVWMLLLARDQRIVMQQADLRERALVLLLEARLDLTLSLLADRARALQADPESAQVAARIAAELERQEGVCALLCVDAEGRRRWIAPPAAGAAAPIGAMLEGTADETAASASIRTGEPVISDPATAPGKPSDPDVLVAIPLQTGSQPTAALFIVDVDRILHTVVESIDPGAPVELIDGNRLPALRPGSEAEGSGAAEPPGAPEGAGGDATPVGRPVQWEDVRLVIRALPAAADADRAGSSFPDLLLGSLAAACALVGSTVHFAQRSAERARASGRARQQLEQLIEASDTVAVVATDREGLVTIFNRGAERITGLAAGPSALRSSAIALFDPDELRSLPIRLDVPAASLLDQLSRSSEFRLRDWTWIGREGQRRRVSVAVRPWLDVNGMPLGFLLVAIDVTERERAMLSIERARAAAEDRSQQKASLLAGVTHELRSPMSAILGAADLLSDASATPQERAEWVRAIRANGTHLLGIINDILDVSKIEAGRMPVESIEVRPIDLANDVIQLLQVQASAKGIDLELEHADDGASESVRTDPLRVRQVLVNLVTNAIRHTARGGVRIAVRTQRAGESLEIAFEVADTGEGLTQEQVDMLFGDYVQVGTSEAGRSGGTGLGLAISRRMAELLQGSISVRSMPGEGSVFTLTLAARLVTPAIRAGEDALGAQAAGTALRGRRILLAEEDAGNRALLARVLGEAGGEVETCASGADAVAAVARSAGRRDFDVVLLDLQERGTDGIATVCRLRDIGFRGRIVAMAGSALTVDRESCLAAGSDAFAVKPIDPAALVALCASAAAGQVPPRA